ncbi:unnamed protein product [Cuscuta europaea]|uniref:Gnk2-homologous domain-containing protein n=1 Tax=Cuscuta europaea TaxID=41803 RepID=A0A9P0ZBB6_CUSEU|nr:unnamed protein product [Cuscuta europaea]
MALPRHLLLLLLGVISSFCIFTTAEDPSGLYCNSDSQKPDDQTLANIKNLISSRSKLVAGASRDGYAAASSGESNRTVYGLAQCRSDVSQKDCSSCLQEASKKILENCTDRVDARIWYDYCFMRYNTEKFYGDVDTGFTVIYANVENVTDPLSFNKTLGKLEADISKQATAPKNKGLGKGKVKLSDFTTLYALGQCTRDLSPANCAQCLAIGVGNNFPGFCSNKKGCRVLYSSCYLRYELYPFYFPLDKSENNNTTQSRKYYSSVIH